MVGRILKQSVLYLVLQFSKTTSSETLSYQKAAVCSLCCVHTNLSHSSSFDSRSCLQQRCVELPMSPPPWRGSACSLLIKIFLLKLASGKWLFCFLCCVCLRRCYQRAHFFLLERTSVASNFSWGMSILDHLHSGWAFFWHGEYDFFPSLGAYLDFAPMAL